MSDTHYEESGSDETLCGLLQVGSIRASNPDDVTCPECIEHLTEQAERQQHATRDEGGY